MNTTPQNRPTGSGISPDEARAALQQASSHQVVVRRDRTIFGWGTAISGLAIGAYVAVSQGLALGAFAWLSTGVVAAFYVLALLGIDAWQRRNAGSIPRGAKKAGYVALAATLVLMMVAIGALNWRGQAAPNPAWELLLAGLLVAAPLGLTGMSIGRSRA